MDYKRTIVALVLVVASGCKAQPLQQAEMAWPSRTNNSSGVFPVYFPPVANSFFQIIPENTFVYATIATNLVQDPQGIVPVVTTTASAQVGNNNGLPTGNGSTQPLLYNPLNSYVGDDYYVYLANNHYYTVSNLMEYLIYSTAVPSTTCSGLLYTGAVCNFRLPLHSGTNYFFSIYSNPNFSNTYFWNDSSASWSSVSNSISYKDTFSKVGANYQGVILFPHTLTNITICVSSTVSNSLVIPCTTYSSNLFFNVMTNSVTQFQLQGSGGTSYLISVQTTNGYLTNLNTSSGAVVYVETNNAATIDSFNYCVTNNDGRGCYSCSTAIINILTTNQLSTCGQCFNISPINGGAVTGTVQFNTGIPSEQVCIYYTNAACQLTTNCGVTDNSGNISFFINFCSGSSNYCISSLAYITNLYYATSVTVSGAGCTVDCTLNSVYTMQSLNTFNNGQEHLYESLTNSDSSSFWYICYSDYSGFCYDSSYGLVVNQYTGSEQYSKQTLPLMTGNNLSWPGWFLYPGGMNPVGSVTANVTNLLFITPICGP